MKIPKAKRKALSTPHPEVPADARLVIALGRDSRDIMISVKGRYGWLTAGLIERLVMDVVETKLQEDYVRPGTCMEPVYWSFKPFPIPKKLSEEDRLYADYVHGLLEGKPTDDDEDIKNEQAAQRGEK